MGNEDAHNWNQILNNNFPGIDLKHVLKSEEKWYAKTYKDFVNTYKYSDEEIARMMSSDTMQFYTAEERKQIIEKLLMSGSTRVRELAPNSRLPVSSSSASQWSRFQFRF